MLFLYLRIFQNVLTNVLTWSSFIYMNTTQTLLSGYRGSKVHAVDTDTYRNRAMLAAGHEAFSLCGWPVMVGDVEFSDSGIITCRNCAKAARP